MFLASVPVNSEGGSYMTFGIPIGIFCVVGIILYVLLFARPVPRIPPRRIRPAHAGAPGVDAARAAAVAGGLPTAAGGGSTESRAEAPGAHLEATTSYPETGNMPTRGRHAADDPDEQSEGTE
jgi:hypothetical protein